MYIDYAFNNFYCIIQESEEKFREDTGSYKGVVWASMLQYMCPFMTKKMIHLL